MWNNTAVVIYTQTNKPTHKHTNKKQKQTICLVQYRECLVSLQISFSGIIFVFLQTICYIFEISKKFPMDLSKNNIHTPLKKCNVNKK